MIMPVGIDFLKWAHNLTIDFPSDTIPMVHGESEWRWFGDIVAGSPSFARAGVPGTAKFSDWKEWALRVYELLG